MSATATLNSKPSEIYPVTMNRPGWTVRDWEHFANECDQYAKKWRKVSDEFWYWQSHAAHARRVVAEMRAVPCG